MKSALRARLPVLLGGGFLILMFAGVVWVIHGLISQAEAPAKRQVQVVSLVKPPPPKPPEEKPPEEKLPEPEKLDNKVVLEEAVERPTDDGPPPGDQLGLDADASAGGDGFGLAARKGGRDITTLGGGRSGDAFAWYAGTIQRALQERLARNEKVKAAQYRVMVKIWVGPGGAVERFELLDSSGDAEVDKALRHVLAGLTDLRDPPPDMPQPVKLRITSRQSG